jgi:hypothetical protein
MRSCCCKSALLSVVRRVHAEVRGDLVGYTEPQSVVKSADVNGAVGK